MSGTDNRYDNVPMESFFDQNRMVALSPATAERVRGWDSAIWAQLSAADAAAV